MTLLEYFLLCISKETYVKRKWILESFMLPVEGKEFSEELMPFVQDGQWVTTLNGTPVVINTPVDLDKPLLDIKEKITLGPEVMECITEEIKTTVGNAIFNAIAIEYPFKGKVPFMNGKVTGKKLDAMIVENLKNKTITAVEFKGPFHKAMGFLTVFSTIVVPAATPKSITGPTKALNEFKDKFLKENAGKLDDPAVIAKMDEGIVEILREHLEGDLSNRHLLKGKMFTTVLKKLYGSMGGSANLEDGSKVDLVANSLENGWEPEDLATVTNALRLGSLLRGKSTALGGYATKILSRAYANLEIKPGDCGTKIGLGITLSKEDYMDYVGRYKVGSKEPLAEGDLKALIGKPFYLRDPNACKEPDGNLCSVCLGDKIAGAKVGMASLMSSLGSQQLSISLAAFHANELTLQEYETEKRFV